eukprot:6190234-Alexandrium_andersonii.AAC.1
MPTDCPTQVPGLPTPACDASLLSMQPDCTQSGSSPSDAEPARTCPNRPAGVQRTPRAPFQARV